MRITRKIVSLMLVCLLIFPLGACGKKTTQSSKSNEKETSSMISKDNDSETIENEDEEFIEDEENGEDETVSEKTIKKSTKKSTAKKESKEETVIINVSDYANAGDDNDIIAKAVDYVTTQSISAYVKGKKRKFILNFENRKYNLSQKITLNNCKNVTLQGNGATFSFSVLTNAFYLKKCTNVNINNLSVDYDPLPYIQGTVTEVKDTDYTITVDNGYREDNDFIDPTETIYLNIHDPKTGGFKAGTSVDYTVRNIQNPQRHKVTFELAGTSKVAANPAVGDAITLYQRKETAILIYSCEGTVLNGVNLYSAPGFGISDQYGSGGTELLNCKIIPGPKPNGAAQNRLRSTNADATHFQVLKKGPVLENCTITHSGDDGINVHGYFYYVLQTEGNTIYFTPKTESPIKKGETITIYDGKTFNEKGNAKVTAFGRKNDTKFTAEITELWRNTIGGCLSTELIYCVKVEKALKNIKQGDLLICGDNVGSGAVIRNCKFGYNRARCVVIKCMNAVIEGNRMISSSSPAIMAVSDLEWAESSFPVNLVIRNNKITGCASGAQARYGDGSSAGDIMVGIPANDGFRSGKPCKNVLIEGNTIENSGIFGIFVCNTNGLTIKNNTVTNPFITGINNIGTQYKITPKSGIFVGMCNDVTVTGNKVKSNLKNITKAVEIMNNCTDVKSNKGNNFN